MRELADFRRYTFGSAVNEWVNPDVVPWDNAVSEAAFPMAKDYGALKQATRKQGYVDLTNPDVPLKSAVSMAVGLLVDKPESKVTFIKDPKNLLKSAADVTKAAVERITGGNAPDYGAFGFSNDDQEIYSDGDDGFVDGEWGYNVTQAWDTAQNQALKSSPPKVTVTRVKGKTGEGWKIEVSRPYQFYDDVGRKAAEAAAADMAKEGIYPEAAGGTFHPYPKELADKWRKKSKKGVSEAQTKGKSKAPKCASCGKTVRSAAYVGFEDEAMCAQCRKLYGTDQREEWAVNAASNSNLTEAADDTYLAVMKGADAAFLEKAATILRKRHGKKFEVLKVYKGISTVYLSFRGQDKGDIEIDGFVALSTQSWTDVNVVLDAKHAMKGHIERTVPFKTGVLTPEAVADIVSEQMGK